jgi:hypothetical protein
MRQAIDHRNIMTLSGFQNYGLTSGDPYDRAERSDVHVTQLALEAKFKHIVTTTNIESVGFRLGEYRKYFP